METHLTSYEENGKIVGYEYKTELKSDILSKGYGPLNPDAFKSEGKMIIEDKHTLTVTNYETQSEAIITTGIAPETYKTDDQKNKGVAHNKMAEWFFGLSKEELPAYLK